MPDVAPGKVDALALEVAVKIVKGLGSQQEVSDVELTALREEVTPAGLLEGFSAIVYALVRLIDDYPEQFTIRDDGYTKVFTSRGLLEAAVESLRAHGVRESDVPTVAGALAAASLGVLPSDWRLRLGPFVDEEMAAWAWLAWFLATFIDRIRQEPGLALAVIQETIDMAAATSE